MCLLTENLRFPFFKSLYVEGKLKMILPFGKRRIGKTELLNEFAWSYKALYIVARQETSEGQLKKMSAEVAEFWSQSTGDSAWHSFVLKLQYKAEWVGKTVLKINQWLPSSKTCNICGYKHPNLTESIREWQCSDCKNTLDRDINAAINIKNFALAEREVELGDSLTKVRGMNQEAPML